MSQLTFIETVLMLQVLIDCSPVRAIADHKGVKLKSLLRRGSGHIWGDNSDRGSSLTYSLIITKRMGFVNPYS